MNLVLLHPFAHSLFLLPVLPTLLQLLSLAVIQYQIDRIINVSEFSRRTIHLSLHSHVLNARRQRLNRDNHISIIRLRAQILCLKHNQTVIRVRVISVFIQIRHFLLLRLLLFILFLLLVFFNDLILVVFFVNMHMMRIGIRRQFVHKVWSSQISAFPLLALVHFVHFAQFIAFDIPLILAHSLHRQLCANMLLPILQKRAFFHFDCFLFVYLRLVSVLFISNEFRLQHRTQPV
mmetsp:Transcript_11663/g.18825  ORF Transcript_11663/g.18825 Transcript_11663/m.18825 type:complete len:234 (-) Transcript_11663:187-888(-)